MQENSHPTKILKKMSTKRSARNRENNPECYTGRQEVIILDQATDDILVTVRIRNGLGRVQSYTEKADGH